VGIKKGKGSLKTGWGGTVDWLNTNFKNSKKNTKHGGELDGTGGIEKRIKNIELDQGGVSVGTGGKRLRPDKGGEGEM